jgi:hypothetical protein
LREPKSSKSAVFSNTSVILRARITRRCRITSAKCPHPTSIRPAITHNGWKLNAISFRRRDCCVCHHRGS